MRAKSAASDAQARDTSINMEKFVSVFHASSLNTQETESQPPASDAYYHNPAQYWQMIGHYDAAMDMCRDFPDVRPTAECDITSVVTPDVPCSSVNYHLR